MLTAQSWAGLVLPVACTNANQLPLSLDNWLRFKSMVSFLHDTVLTLADIAAAIAQTGERAHAGYLVLAKIVTTLQQASPVPARLHGCGSTPEIALLPARGFWLCQGEIFERVFTYACLCVQVLDEGAVSHPARITSSLSVEYLWGQLVPDFAALVRSTCVALEAWPQEVAKPVLFPDPGDVKLDAPLGLQYKVRHSVFTCSALSS